MPLIDDLKTIAPPNSHRGMSHPDQLWRASMLSYCPRKQILAAKGINLRTPDWLLRKFSLHSGAHDNVQNWVVQACSGQHEVLTEYPVYDHNTRCGGHIDAVVVEDHVANVIEIKTYTFLKGDPKEDSYWQQQISFYYHVVNDQQLWMFVQPVIMIATFEGQVRVVEPAISENFRDILFKLNIAWDSDTLPEYLECYSNDCAKCSLQPICTEPIDTISEFAETVKASIGDNS